MDNISLITAFGAGLLSFISPCVLPIVPGYLSFISGVSIEDLQGKKSNATRRVFLNSLFFVLGFSVVFIALGASATLVSNFLLNYMHIIAKVAGVFIIILGLHYMGQIHNIYFRIGCSIFIGVWIGNTVAYDWYPDLGMTLATIISVIVSYLIIHGLYFIGFFRLLNYEKRFNVSDKKLGMVGAFLVGFAFAFGWTPCIGPILAAILAIAAAEDTIGRGIILLSFYSAGLAIPFLLTSLAFNKFLTVSSKIKKHFKTVEIIGGILLLTVGLLIFTNSLGYLSGILSDWFPWLELG
ncbi:MAG: cytochrome C biogenesis protein [candidate division Zixibacteria bacterium]|nr:cytochrome C biogenesis protein [candidate division Zixibacteria bacterium]